MEPMYEYLENLGKTYTPQKILDIGAWNGFWTENCQKFWPASHYTCIEAGQHHKQKLGLIANKVHIAVVGDENKSCDMNIMEVNNKTKKFKYTKGSSLFPIPSGKKDHRQMVTLKSLVGDQKFNFIKQDVQGAEMLVMKGSPEVFKKADYVLNEVNIKKEFFLAPDVVEMNEFMKELGFNRQETIADHPGKNQIDVLYWKD